MATSAKEHVAKLYEKRWQRLAQAVLILRREDSTMMVWFSSEEDSAGLAIDWVVVIQDELVRATTVQTLRR